MTSIEPNLNQIYNVKGTLFSLGSAATYWTMLLKGAMPEPLAIITIGLSLGVLKEESVGFTLMNLGTVLKY